MGIDNYMTITYFKSAAHLLKCAMTFFKIGHSNRKLDTYIMYSHHMTFLSHSALKFYTNSKTSV